MNLPAETGANPSEAGGLRPSEIALVVPAYQPSAVLVELVREVRERGLQQFSEFPIVIVDDGSSASATPVFQALEQLSGVTVLRHAVNLGKGAALKTAFNFCLVTFGSDLRGVVTADADGQHLPADILSVIQLLRTSSNDILLGTRKFDQNVPARSRFGNQTTRVVFKFFTHRSLEDTQTGLRGLPLLTLKRALRIPSQGYDFELEMLVTEAQQGVRFREVPIQTVYEPGNPTSHFNPIFDSVKIYYVFFRYSVLALVAATLDYSIFLLFLSLSDNVFASVLVGRFLTGYFYFHAARSRVFRSTGKPAPQAVKFVLLVAASMCASYGLLTVQVILLHVPIALAKIFAELVLFLSNFAIQRLFVFHSDNVRESS